MPSHQLLDHARKRSTDRGARAGATPLPRSRLSSELARTDSLPSDGEAGTALVFTDPVAFRYLEDEAGTVVVARRQPLPGYELYVVEQWACSRKRLTFVITAFTGQEHHAVTVDVLRVPVDAERWTPRLRAYLHGLAELHAREKETPLGALWVTNLSSFPSALTVIPVPGGDIGPLRETFEINENLKRLGCSGRAGLDLSAPSAATRAKFAQVYRTSEAVPIGEAVIELVKMCQIALVIFDVLASAYADGLLCDVTEQAIRDWWAKFGTEFYDIEPSDGILGPTTVAALLGMLLGARNRLKGYGAPVAKDVFDVKATERGIAYFQRFQKLEKTRRLDPETLERLHRVTSKAANNEGWGVPKAVKSTVADLSGKGGEMVMGMVRKDRAGMADAESIDISTFVASVSGERAKWLWQGKPRKNATGGNADDADVFSADETAAGSKKSRLKDSTVDAAATQQSRPQLERIYSNASGSQTSLAPSDKEKDTALRKTVLKSMTGKMSDAKSGLGRFRDAVGERTGLHRHGKLSRDDTLVAGAETNEQDGEDIALRQASGNIATIDHQEKAPRAPSTRDGTPKDEDSPDSSMTSPLGRARFGIMSASAVVSSPMNVDAAPELPSPSLHGSGSGNINTENFSSENASSTELVQAQDRTVAEPYIPAASRSTLSLHEKGHAESPNVFNTKLPRSLSFGAVENVLDGRADCEDEPFELNGKELELQWAVENHLAAQIKRRLSQLSNVERVRAQLAHTRGREMEASEAQAHGNNAALEESLYDRSTEFESLRQAATDIIGEEKSSLDAAIESLKGLAARLEYELNALLSKVEDVEDGVAEFERQVQYLEERITGLEEEEMRDQPWYRRLSRLLMGRL